jgi:hypothetical protein
MVIAPASAGDVTVTVAPSDAPAGTSINITVSAADACSSTVQAFTMADSRVTLSGTDQLAWSAASPAPMPPVPAEVTETPSDGYQLFIGIGCLGPDGKLSSVACTDVRVLPAGAAPTGSKTASFVSGPDLLNTDRELSECESSNAVPVVLIPGQIQSMIGFVNQTWYALLSPVAATTTTSTTLRVPVSVAPTAPTTPPTTPTT